MQIEIKKQNKPFKHTSAPSLISFSQEAHRLAPYEDYALALQAIRRTLNEKYRCSFQLYLNEEDNDMYWDLLEEELQTGQHEEVEWVCSIYEHIESIGFAVRPPQTEASQNAEQSYHWYPTLRNNVFAYPSYGVALARVPMFRPHGIGYDDYIYAVSEECLERFLHYTQRRRRELSGSKVIVFTDRSHGTVKQLVPITRSVPRESVIMDASLKQEIFRLIDSFFSADRSFFQEYDIPYKRGILLYGKPGNGKTTLVKSIAGSIPAPIAYWQITEHTCSDTIEEVFEAAVSMAPMVLVIEDIDAMPAHTRSYFLNTLDGATSREGLFIIGTTNYPENIDPALMNRAGRFDRAYEIKLPDADMRLGYFQKRGLPKLLPELGMQQAVKLTAGLTFAQLGELYVLIVMHVHFESDPVDVEKLVRHMKEELDKGRAQAWLKEENEKIGFIF